MYDTQITLAGWIGGEVTMREVAQGRHVASFRMACTPTRYRDGEWVKGTTSWHTVKVWNRLARHVAASLRNGDPVVVHGQPLGLSQRVHRVDQAHQVLRIVQVRGGVADLEVDEPDLEGRHRVRPDDAGLVVAGLDDRAQQPAD